MLRSIWFWVIVIGAGLLFFLGRGPIASYMEKIPLQTTPRTTNTRALASASPAIARTVTAVPRTSASRQATASPGATSVPQKATVSKPLPKTPSPKKTAAISPSYIIYVVKKGDTLYRISKRYNTTVAELQRINGIRDPSKLAAGQELKVPKRASASAPAAKTPVPGTKTYRVRPGDTLSSIARKFNTSVGTLQKLNNISNPNQLKVGAVILAPATSAARPPAATTRPPSPAADRSTVEGGEQEVRIMPVLTATSPSAKAGGAATTPPSPAASPTPTPLPTLPSVCEGNRDAVFVWGVSFCMPPGWTLQEYARPHRTALLTKNESSGDRSIYAISKLEGSPNAPLSWTMRQAKSALPTEIAALIPGGLATPSTWTSATAFEIAHVQGQMSEAVTTYLKTGHAAHVRIVVFNAGGQRWRVVMVAPEALWQGYDATVFPYIARTLEVF